MRELLLKDYHDGPLKSHGGVKHTTTFLKKSYYWPNLKDNVEEYVKTCVATPLWDKCEDETHTPKSGKLKSSGTPGNLEL